MKPPENILIVRTDRIGDVVLTLPLPKLIKKHCPGSKVTFMLRDYTQPLAAGNHYIDDILLFNEDQGIKSFFKNLKVIRARKFDYTIVVYPTFRIALLIFLSGIKNRIGTGYRWYSFLFNLPVYEHRKYAEKHELEYNVNLLRRLGIIDEISRDNVEFNLHVDPVSLKSIHSKLKETGVDNSLPLIIIHPGSGGSSIDLPLHKFYELVEKIIKKFSANILITGTEIERSVCGSLAIDSKVKNLAGLFSLKELIALISKTDLFISNSTGPIHIAAALGKFTIGFYPKILSASAERWGPYTTRCAVFKPELNCTDCNEMQCKKLNCMETINIDAVMKTVERHFTGKNK